jgi:hypothetical protein
VNDWPTDGYLTLLELMELDVKMEKIFPWDPKEE